MRICKYFTLAILKDGTVGNVKQSTGQFVTDLTLSQIEDALNKVFEDKKQKAFITEVKEVKGFVLK